MSPMLLDGVAGTLYLLHKVFSDLVEEARGKAFFWRYRFLASFSYLLGILPTVLVFWQTKRLIFGLIEAGGTPAMIGAVFAAAKHKDPPKWLVWIAAATVPFGIWLTATHHIARNLPPWLDTTAYWLEIGGALGFLVGVGLQMFESKAVAKWAYAFFLLMNIATACLMAIDGRWLWVPQQALSIVFIVDALMGAPLMKRMVEKVRACWQWLYLRLQAL